MLSMCIGGCSVQPLLQRENSGNNIFLHVNAPSIYMERTFYKAVYQKLKQNSTDLININIKITLTCNTDIVAFSKNGAILDATQIIAKITLIDYKTQQILKEFELDEYTSYFVDDNDPFASTTSEKSSINAALQLLAISVANNIIIQIKYIFNK